MEYNNFKNGGTNVFHIDRCIRPWTEQIGDLRKMVAWGGFWWRQGVGGCFKWEILGWGHWKFAKTHTVMQRYEMKKKHVMMPF